MCISLTVDIAEEASKTREQQTHLNLHQSVPLVTAKIHNIPRCPFGGVGQGIEELLKEAEGPW